MGGNYFTTSINKDSTCWLVWDKKHPEGVHFADVELAWTSFESAARVFRYLWNGMIQEHMGSKKEKRIHPTQKPIALYEWILDKYAKETDIILDTHVGSGSSLIACHRKRLNYVGFELDENYYRAAKKRIDEEAAQLSIFDFIEE